MFKKFTRLSLVFTLVVMMLPEAAGQKIEKYYTHRTQEEGDLYFLYPNTDFKNSDDRSEFSFDITYRPTTGTTIFNFTYLTAEPAPADSLLMIAGKNQAAAPATKLYMDFKKKRWVQRYSAAIPYEALAPVFQSASPPVITVFAAGKPLTFVVKRGKWEKYHAAVEKIFYIISENAEADSR